MTPIGTCRLYRPDPTSVGVHEQWSGASADAERTHDDVLVVSIHGEVDAGNCARLADYLERHAAISGSLIVDTSAVVFFAASALAVLHRVDRSCTRGGTAWRLVAGPAVRRVMRVCGTADLPQVENVENALRQLDSRHASVDG
ncbi:STAS domain-containing protein [Mycolicibacterium sp.]|uniref:STAS domain-containing protein n=1 Tax=Mycolicibacterium sp. TaxID=2320850 RepID=UPI001A34434B|nr:STAS domain-containing protein [Mycolicibacterium sp.]MBJ7338733.1 STAS domain-containing protein [Mycolicibacterium sp.]